MDAGVLGGKHVVVVGAGLAGIAAALESADNGARVTVLERRKRIGGMTWSFEHNGFTIDNGQHVYLRCCTDYTGFLDRIGATQKDARISGPLDIPVVAPPTGPSSSPKLGRIKRNSLPAPLHLLGSLAAYPHLSTRDRLRLGQAVWALQRVDLGDPRLDDQTFAEWLTNQGQSRAAIEGLWDLITVPTVNLPAAEASLAMGAKVFQTGLLRDRDAADIGWSRVPLGQLHGDLGERALAGAGAAVRTSTRVRSVRLADSGFEVLTEDDALQCDAVVVSVPHNEAGSVLPSGSVTSQERLEELGSSAVVDIHLVYDQRVTDWELMAGHASPVQWVFDRSSSAGLGGGDHRQYLAVSLSAADELLGTRPDELVSQISEALAQLLPRARTARVVDSLVTKERYATFRATKGTAKLRPPARTRFPGLVVAGAWTDTGWPATMEGAVRSGKRAAAELVADLAAGPGTGSAPITAPGADPCAKETTQEVA